MGISGWDFLKGNVRGQEGFWFTDPTEFLPKAGEVIRHHLAGAGG